ncbi:mitochondrial amidoxime reducing component 2-like [Amphiura filiformis]|uniref:mitochondrial amidoxime reducing component 2-like n=1 Tax=Amphiura filiformis TaxID=82378 RepID=UPI003B20DD25
MCIIAQQQSIKFKAKIYFNRSLVIQTKMSDNLKAIAVGCVAGIAVYGLYKYGQQKFLTRKSWQEVGKIGRIFIHPVKACRGIEITEATCTKLYGIKSNAGVCDRHYVILDENNSLVSMRQDRALAFIHPNQSEGGKSLQLDAPGMPTVKFPLHQAITNDVIHFRLFGRNSTGYNCGDEVSNWLNTYLKTTGHKLVCFTKDIQTSSSIYQDMALYNLFTEASLDDLNSRLEKKITARNFRPNFVVQGQELTAFEEDNWKYIKIGDNVILRKTIRSGRCKQTTVDPETGIVGDEPLKTLKTYRNVDASHPAYKELAGSPSFGIYMNLEAEGTVAVGDSVYIAN